MIAAAFIFIVAILICVKVIFGSGHKPLNKDTYPVGGNQCGDCRHLVRNDTKHTWVNKNREPHFSSKTCCGHMKGDGDRIKITFPNWWCELFESND